MKEILESFIKSNSICYLEVVNSILQGMTAEEILSLPTVKIDDEFRRVAENHGLVFSIIKENQQTIFYSLGSYVFRSV